MNSGRVLRMELTSSEVDILTKVMCVRGCSIEDAARHLIAKHGRSRRSLNEEHPSSNKYMRDYMRDYRQAMRLGIPVSEYRKRKHAP
jgi:hypothetical protein